MEDLVLIYLMVSALTTTYYSQKLQDVGFCHCLMMGLLFPLDLVVLVLNSTLKFFGLEVHIFYRVPKSKVSPNNKNGYE
jgi:hypothetical protein